eukprot:4651784-Pyramimonas_sp.AAC.1
MQIAIRQQAAHSMIHLSKWHNVSDARSVLSSRRFRFLAKESVEERRKEDGDAEVRKEEGNARTRGGGR